MRKAERASGRKVYASHEWTKNRSKTKSKSVSLVWSASAVTPTCLVRSVSTPSRHTQEAWLPRWRAVSLFPSLSLSLWLAITLPTSNRLPQKEPESIGYHNRFRFRHDHYLLLHLWCRLRSRCIATSGLRRWWNGYIRLRCGDRCCPMNRCPAVLTDLIFRP